MSPCSSETFLSIRSTLARSVCGYTTYERSRWRLRRTRQAMGKAARFRLLFGWMGEASAPPK